VHVEKRGEAHASHKKERSWMPTSHVILNKGATLSFAVKGRDSQLQASIEKRKG
jgi:hypothetical protein